MQNDKKPRLRSDVGKQVVALNAQRWLDRFTGLCDMNITNGYNGKFGNSSQFIQIMLCSTCLQMFSSDDEFDSAKNRTKFFTPLAEQVYFNEKLKSE